MIILCRFLIISLFILKAAQAHLPFYIQSRESLEKQVVESINSFRFTNIYGLSGMGKTTISKKIKESLKNKSRNTIWLNWDHISINEQINNKIRENNCDSVQKFLKKMANIKPLIVIIDNYNEVDLKKLEETLGELYNCERVKFLISSRQKMIDSNGVQISPFTEEEALALMLKYFPSENVGRLKNIANKLGRYPYFVSVLCRAVELSNTLSLERLESILDSNPKEIISRDFTMDIASKGINSLGNTAIGGILNELKKDDNKAYLTLGFMSLLNSKSIPLQLIHAFIGDEKEGDRIIEKLSSLPMFSSVNKKSKYITYDLHEITQKIIYENLTESDKSFLLKKLPDAFATFYRVDFVNISAANEEDQIFFNHLFSIIEKFKLDKRILPLRILAIKRSIYSGEILKSEFNEAKIIDELQPEKFLDNQDILFEYYVEWAFIYCFRHGDDKKKFEKGIEFGKKALEIAKKNKDTLRIFKAQTRLIWVYLYAGKVEESKRFLNKAAELLAQIEDPYLRKEYFFASSWYFLEEGNFKEAYSLASQGVEIDSTSKSFYKGLYLRSFKAQAAYRLGLLDSARETLEEALVRESAAFKDDSSLARTEMLQSKSMVDMDEKKYKDAEESIAESIRIFTKKYGKKPYTPKAVSMKLHSEILFRKGNISEANSMVQDTLAMYRELIKGEGTYEFGEALLLKAKIDLMSKNYDSFLKILQETDQRFGKDSDFHKKIRENAILNGCEWLLA